MRRARRARVRAPNAWPTPSHGRLSARRLRSIHTGWPSGSPSSTPSRRDSQIDWSSVGDAHPFEIVDCRLSILFNRQSTITQSTIFLMLTHEIAQAVRREGGRALVVGGWVRDKLLGRDSKDVDIEVFGIQAARLREILEALGRVELVGEAFQVFKLG